MFMREVAPGREIKNEVGLRTNGDQTFNLVTRRDPPDSEQLPGDTVPDIAFDFVTCRYLADVESLPP